MGEKNILLFSGVFLGKAQIFKMENPNFPKKQIPLKQIPPTLKNSEFFSEKTPPFTIKEKTSMMKVYLERKILVHRF